MTRTLLGKSYEPSQIEPKWYRFWVEQGYFHADESAPRAPYTIVIPPPNVTGSLHMGHALTMAIQDILIRWRRMAGYNALWLPGTDHAGIATQMVVERMLMRTEQKSRHDFGREEFLKRVWKWKEQHGGRITEQLKVIGASLDWQRERFTMDEGLTKAVREAFVRLHEEGLIYRAERLINWCPRCSTSLSDLEVEHEDREGRLWHIAYPVKGTDRKLVVATTRPETMLGDTAVAVHPEDERYQDLLGRKVALPLTDREIPIIGDAILVDPKFGTGAVKVTPGHDFNDFEVGQRHGLPNIAILDLQARLNDNVPARYRGLGVAEARETVVKDLEAAGLLEKVEPYPMSIGACYRCRTITEPTLSLQWFVRTAPLAKVAAEVVEDGRITFVPEGWSKTYLHWMHNIKDWCISRQLWWGHRIPVWYCPCGETIVSRQDPTECPKCKGTALKQDEDVLDTWFSSSLWPFSTLGWPADTRELKSFYPTSVMETGYDIIFFWVARMVMMGMHFMKKVPFRTVFLHAMVVDEDGQKMSKVKGNVIDPLDVIYGATLESLMQKAEGDGAPKDALANVKKRFSDGIPECGADALRFTLAALAAQGRNIRLSIPRVEGYRHFANKIWNASRFVLMNLSGFDADRFADNVRDGAREMPLSLPDRWVLSRLHRTIKEIDEALEQFKINEAAQGLYRFFWNELCDWYIELAKPTLYADGNEAEAATRKRMTQGCLAVALETAMRLLHPFMPFITEEIWQQLPKASGAPQSIMITLYPVADDSMIDEQAEKAMALLQDVVVAIRNLRAEYRISPAVAVDVVVQTSEDRSRTLLDNYRQIVVEQAKCRRVEVESRDQPPAGSVKQVVGDVDVYLVIEGVVDIEAEVKRLEKDLGKAEKELESVEKKLDNASFVERAPAEVVTRERERAADARTRIASLREGLARLEAFRC
jgi:valyl-tRNA synthetase